MPNKLSCFGFFVVILHFAGDSEIEWKKNSFMIYEMYFMTLEVPTDIFKWNFFIPIIYPLIYKFKIF